MKRKSTDCFGGNTGFFPYIRGGGCSGALLALLITLSACDRPVVRDPDDPRLGVVATTTIVGDIVQRVGGDDIHLRVLMPFGADPHDYIFRPDDMAAASDADILFTNGAGLEGHLDRLLSNVAALDRIVSLDENIPVRCFEENERVRAAADDAEHPRAERSHYHHEECDHGYGDVDPHFWTDPNNVMIWAQTIADALSKAAPERSDAFQARTDLLIEELQELDQWIEQQVSTIPEKKRVLITDHLSHGYFLDRYGFEQVGVLLRSFDTMAQPSAREIARLIDTLGLRNVPAIFVGETVDPSLARQITRDTGTRLVTLHSGSLTDAEGTAPDYFAYMRYNVNAMVRHLADGNP